jgi:hypothetical protein
LDSASALEFVKSLKLGCKIFSNTSFVAVYQSSEEMSNPFDKVILLYEGRQVYSGPAGLAKRFFYDMGFGAKSRQPTPDFLTSLTQPSESIIRPGFEHSAPRTPDEVAARWRQSVLYQDLIQEIEELNDQFPIAGPSVAALYEAHKACQSPKLFRRLPYTVSFGQQIRILNGAEQCPAGANPAEWMLHGIGAAPGSVAKFDYAETWNNSPECVAVHAEIELMMSEFGVISRAVSGQGTKSNNLKSREFDASLISHYFICHSSNL